MRTVSLAEGNEQKATDLGHGHAAREKIIEILIRPIGNIQKANGCYDGHMNP